MNGIALIDRYAAGPQRLRGAVADLTEEQVDRASAPGKWSTRQVVCHIADYELIYADRIKRAISEEEPTILAGQADAFAARLAYEQRDIEAELRMIESVRQHMAPILCALSPADFQRIAHHSTNGAQAVEQLLRDVVDHLLHHTRFIDEKQARQRSEKIATENAPR